MKTLQKVAFHESAQEYTNASTKFRYLHNIEIRPALGDKEVVVQFLTVLRTAETVKLQCGSP